MMTRKTLGLLILLAGIGCSAYDRPRDLRNQPKPDLDVSPAEQEKRIRGRYSIPQDDPRVGPKTGLERNTPLGW